MIFKQFSLSKSTDLGIQVKKEKKPVNYLSHILSRCKAWGFSTSGVERTFARGGWMKCRREVSESLANDELWAVHLPEGLQDEFLGLFWLWIVCLVLLFSFLLN